MLQFVILLISFVFINNIDGGSDLFSLSASGKYKYMSQSPESGNSYEREYKFRRKKMRGSWDWRSEFDKDQSMNGIPEKIAGEKLHRNAAIKEVKHRRKPSTAAVIFLHGSGGTGVELRDLLEWFRKDQNLCHGVSYIKFLFPTSPVKEYTAIFGQKQRVWHDRQGIHTNLPEMKKSVDEQAQDLKVFIENLVESGIPINRIVIGGFSMGGGMALHMAYRYFPQMAGCFTLSSFLHHDSMVYEHLRNSTVNKENLPPLISFHGDKDYLVPLEWGKEMFNNITATGLKGEFHLSENTCHELNRGEMNMLWEWFEKVLPRDYNNPETSSQSPSSSSDNVGNTANKL